MGLLLALGCGTYLPPRQQGQACTSLDCSLRPGAVFYYRSPTVAQGFSDARYTTLAFSTEGQLRLVFGDEGDAQVEYATLAPDGSWLVQQVGSGEFPSMVLDAAGFPKVAYYDPSGGRIGLASVGRLAWESVYTPVAGEVVSQIAMAIDSLGTVHLAFFEEESGPSGPTDRLIYVSWGAGAARREVVTDLGVSRLYAWPLGPPAVSMALRPPSGAPLIAYTSPWGLGVAVRGSGGWSFEAPDPALPNGGYFVSTVAAPDGSVHLVHADLLSAGLRYGLRGPAGGWSFEPADPSQGAGGAGTSIVLDPEGLPFVVYGSAAPQRLWAGVRRGPGRWSLWQAAGGGLSGSWPSVAFHPAGFPVASSIRLDLLPDGTRDFSVQMARIEAYPFP